ncbi:helix-turn-helix domain-containing protein [Streptomyces nigra]|uniref:helix-turn-helix domain-containing protein n=1 Tax=Streptomyces nigra TaxID=1827580 RepID=UPI0036CB16F4
MDLAELGAFLKSRRDQVSPRDVGLPNDRRRRVSGLRRDEVANLAHISVDYYIELERGTAQPSAAVIAPLADALRLNSDEREHLYNLAGRSRPPTAPVSTVLPAMCDLLSRFGEVPAYVTTDLQVVLAQNSSAAELHGPVPVPADFTASFTYRWFVDRAVRAQFRPEDHDAEARALIADLRASAARRDPNDAAVAMLVDELTERSPWFAELWNQREVAIRRREVKRLHHPQRGMVTYHCHALLSDDATQRLIWYVASDEQVPF